MPASTTRRPTAAFFVASRMAGTGGGSHPDIGCSDASHCHLKQIHPCVPVPNVEPGPNRIATCTDAMNTTSRTALLAALLCASPVALAAADDSPGQEPGCVALGTQQQLIRQGDSQHFLLRDGQHVYQVSLHRNCPGLPHARQAVIERDGAKHMLCQRGSELVTDRGKCDIRRFEALDGGSARIPTAVRR